MNFEWRDLIGSLVGSNYRLTEYLGEVGSHGVFATKGGSEPAIVRVARGTSADELATQWSAAMKLKHPSVVQTLETGQTEILDTPLIYTATQPPDDSLSEAVAARSLTAEEAREVLNSVLDG